MANFIPDLLFQGPRPIHWASRNGHVAVVDELLSVSNYCQKRIKNIFITDLGSKADNLKWFLKR